MPVRSRRRAAVVACVLALAAGCRDKAPAPAADSSLAQDLAMAQRGGVLGPSVFNDAPIGAPAPASRAPAAPSPKPEPPRVSTRTPRPSPRQEQPPAPVARAPQPTPPQPVATAPAPAPAPAGPAPGVIGAGTRVGMSMNTRVCTASVLVGDKFTATVTSPTVGTNGAMIPAGATVVLEVASISRADPVESSRIEFRVRAIDVNGEPQPVGGDVATLGTMEAVQASSGNDKTKVIGGAIAGAVLGRVLGKSTKATVIGAAAGAAAGTVAARRSQGSGDACLPEGSPLRLTLSRDIVVRKSAI